MACKECGESGGCMTGAGICNRCLRRLEDELTFLEASVKDILKNEPDTALFAAGGVGHRMILLQARVYSWQPDSGREAWLKARGMGLKPKDGVDDA